MKRGFTLVELLAVLVVIGLLAVIVAPVVSDGLKTNRRNTLEIQKQRIIDAAEDWSMEHLSLLPSSHGGKVSVKLGDIKKGYISINVKNPETGKLLSDESYVVIKNNYGDYEYEVKLYEIPDIIENNSSFSVTGNFTDVTISVGSTVDNYDIVVEKSSGSAISYSKQYILNNNEVASIDTKQKGTYSIVYTFIYNNKIYKRVKTIIVN